jgi:hypothetical protein
MNYSFFYSFFIYLKYIVSMKKTFWQFTQQLKENSPPSGPDGGGGAPPIGGGMGDMGGGMPGVGGSSPMPPMGGGMGDMGGGLGGMGGGMMGGPPPNAGPSGQKTSPIQLKPIDVWSVINRILDGKSIKVEKEKNSVQSAPDSLQSNNDLSQNQNNSQPNDMSQQMNQPMPQMNNQNVMGQ